MTPLFKKLNLGTADTLFVLDAPASFAGELAKLTGVSVHSKLAKKVVAPFVIGFATQQIALNRMGRAIAKCATGDAIVWLAYPKASSKRYVCDFNRDTGWQVLGDAGFEPVRQVAIDADWSALRFRRVEFIKKLTRSQSMAISAAGQQRAAKR